MEWICWRIICLMNLHWIYLILARLCVHMNVSTWTCSRRISQRLGVEDEQGQNPQTPPCLASFLEICASVPAPQIYQINPLLFSPCSTFFPRHVCSTRLYKCLVQPTCEIALNTTIPKHHLREYLSLKNTIFLRYTCIGIILRLFKLSKLVVVL